MKRNFFFSNYYYDTDADKVICKGYNHNGEAIKAKINFKPFCFIRGNGEYRDFHDSYQMLKKEFESFKDLKKYLWNNKEKCYGMGISSQTPDKSELLYSFICDVFDEDMNWNYNYLNILNYDIETSMEHGFSIFDMLNEENPVEKILSIACSITRGEKRFYKVFSYFENVDDVEDHVFCVDEEDMLTKFCEFVSEQNIDIITNWNGNRFDTPYLCLRVENYYDPIILKKLSPFGLSPKKIRKTELNRKTNQEEEYICYDIPGVSELDYMKLYQKFESTYNGSYALNVIANRELGEKKLDYSEEGSLRNLYKENPSKFLKYNLHDVKLVDGIDDKKRFIELGCSIAALSKTRLQDVFGSVRVWDVLIYDYLINRRKLIIPHKKNNIKVSQNRGGKVKDSKLGLSEDVVTIDATSLYPSIIFGLNISPETFVRKVFVKDEDVFYKTIENTWFHEENFSMAGNGCIFKRDKQGILAEIVEKIFMERIRHKDLMKTEKNRKEKADKNIISKYNGFQLAEKILINSAYGVFGSIYFRYYDKNIAEAITVTGQLLISLADKSINSFLNEYLNNEEFKDYVVLSDTDSCGISFSDVIKKEGLEKNINNSKFLIDFVDNKISKRLDEDIKEFLTYLNFYKHSISFKREKICKKMLITGKKRYAATVLNDEGFMYDEPQIIIKGIEVVRSDSSDIVRDGMEKCLEIILKKSEADLQTFVKNYKKKFFSSAPEVLAKPSTVNGLEKYFDPTKIYKLGSPSTVKAALVFNKFVRDNELEHEIELIRSGDKVKTVVLKVPNPLYNDRIACKTFFHKKFGIEKYIDYNTMYEKGFYEPLRRLSDKVGWEIVKQNKFHM